jgi:hypothetical protein
LDGADFELRFFCVRLRARFEVAADSLAIDPTNHAVGDDAVAIPEGRNAELRWLFHV